MTPYETEIGRLQGLVVQALRDHTEPDCVARQLMLQAFPAAVLDGPAAAAGGAAAAAGTAPAPLLKALDAPAKEALANALHAAAAQLLSEAKAAGQEVMRHRLQEGQEQAAVALLVDAVLWLAAQRAAPVEHPLAAQLLEQITEGASIQDCEGVFAYLDSRTAAFKAPPFGEKCKLTLLRTCNMLLKRLSKSANAMLCGRVLLFLAKLLPLTERSGVNLSGGFNTDNATPVEEVAEGALDSEGKPVDAAFYRTFWGLQAAFSDPPSALAGGKWVEVSRDIRRVLEKFRQEKVTVGEGAAAQGAGAGDGQGASVKYLSSSRLMGLQLRDATFRRHFLLQCLILMQWCERPRKKDHSALREKLLKDLQELRAKVYAELEATPDKGRQFAAAVRHLMKWEDSWAAWKQSACPSAPLERAPAQAPAGSDSADLTAPAPKRRKLSSDAVYGIRVGTDQLDRLWNLTEDNTSALSADDRGGFKSVRQLMEPVIEEMKEAAEAVAAGAEDDGLMLTASRSKLYSWKTLRAVARTNLQAFAQAVQKGGDLEVAARMLYPEDCPPPRVKPAPPAPAAAAASPGGVDAISAGKPAGSEAAAAADEEQGAAAEAGDADAEGGEDAAEAGEEEEDGEGEGEEGELPEDEEGQAAAAATAAAAEASGGRGGGSLLEEGKEGEQQARQQQEEAEEGEEEGEAPAAAATDEEGGGDGAAAMDTDAALVE